MKPILWLLLFLSFSSPCFCCYADIIAQWNFNSIPPDSSSSTGTNKPSLGYGTASLDGGITDGYAAGSTTDPDTTDDTGWNTSDYPAQSTGNKTAGVRFAVNTLGYSNIVVRWDHRVSSTASKYYHFQYSTNGVNFNDNGSPITISVASSFVGETNNLTAIPGVNNNGNFAFRIVSEFENTAIGSGTAGYVTPSGTNTYGPGGTVRFDYVTVSGAPIPGANTAPTISSISNQTLRVNQSTALLAFTIGDAEDTPTSLTLNKASSNPAIIPTSSILLGGSGANRTVTINAGSQTGASDITLSVADSGGRSNSTTFTVTVLPLNTAPVLSAIPPTNTLMNIATPPIPFTIGDLESPPDSLTLSGSSSNPSLVANTNIIFAGSGSNRTVTVTPRPGQSGVAIINLSATDGTNQSTSSFPLMVLPSGESLFYDPFFYPDGSLLTNSAFLWANRSGVVGECQLTNGQVEITSSQTEDVSALLVGGSYVRSNSTVLYASFRVKMLTLPKTAPGYFAHFTSGSANRGRVYAGMEGAGAGLFRLFVSNGSGGYTPLPTDLGLNTNYMIVLRYDIDSAVSTLWLNPIAESDPGTTANDSATPANISAFGLREDSSLGGTLRVDDVRVGLSFASVNPPPVLNVQRLGTQIVLSWPNPGYGLQSSPSVSGTFTNIPSATSPFTNTISAGARFFRLKVP